MKKLLLPFLLVACAHSTVRHAADPVPVAEADGEEEDVDDNDMWWNDPPWIDVDSRWAEQATWTSPAGEIVDLKVEELAGRAGIVLMSHGTRGPTMIVPDDFGLGADREFGAVATLDDGGVAYKLDVDRDGTSGISTLYVLHWDAAKQQLAVTEQRTGELEGD